MNNPGYIGACEARARIQRKDGAVLHQKGRNRDDALPDRLSAEERINTETQTRALWAINVRSRPLIAKPITKADLISDIAEQSGISKAQAGEARPASPSGS